MIYQTLLNIVYFTFADDTKCLKIISLRLDSLKLQEYLSNGVPTGIFYLVFQKSFCSLLKENFFYILLVLTCSYKDLGWQVIYHEMPLWP